MEENQVQTPKGWKSYVGNEILTVQGGYAFKSNDYRDDGILLVRIGNVGNGNFVFKDVICVPKRFQITHSNFQLWKGDVLMGLTGDLGKICILKDGDFPYFLNQRVGRFAPTTKIDNEYLYFLVSSSIIQSKFDAFFAGGAQKNISPKQIESINYLIPESKQEQTQIATILSKIDEAIAQTEELIAKYTRIKTGLMQDLLTKGIDEHGNIRSEETHEFKDSPLGRIPKEWECVDLGRNIELHNNKRKPISSKERAHMIGDYPYYGATGIIDMLNVFRVDGEFVLIGEDGDHFLKWVYQEQTILTNGKFNVSNHAHIVKGTSKCSTKWIHYFFCHRDITFYLTRQGAGRFKLNKASLLSLPILLPNSEKEQDAVIDHIEKVNEYSDSLRTQLSKLQSLKTGLMQDLLSGKVRVNHLIKETVTV
jgi:type I restriction enzyme S subunit